MPSPNIYVIACGDEGVQINVGTRLGVVGAGTALPHMAKVITAMKAVFGSDLVMTASSQNDWTKIKYRLDDFEQADATMQQQVAALADQVGLRYAGFLPFADPQQLEFGVKGHMVRPQGIHIGTKIVLTLGGGEQKYHLGHFIISADWVHKAKDEVVKEVLSTQIEFYRSLIGNPKAPIELELAGELGEAVAKKNQVVVERLGIDKL